MDTPTAGRRLTALASLSPGIIAGISATALTSRLAGGLAPWAAAGLVVVTVLGALGWLAALGLRQIPTPLALGSLGSLLVAGLLLQLDEWCALVNLPGAAALGAALRRLPPTAAPAESGGRSRRAAAAPGLELPSPDRARRPVHPAPGRVPLLTTAHRLAFAGGAAVCGFLAGVTLVAVFSDGLDDGSAASRWIGAALGGLFAVLAVVFAAAAIVMRPADLVVDVDGVGRTGRGGWHIDWSDVRAVGLRVRERVPIDDDTPTPVALRRRRSVWLLVAPRGDELTERAELRRLRHPDWHPWTLAERLTATSWRAESRTVERVGQALGRIVPDLYVGVDEV